MADPALVRSGDFDAIEAAVMETARGRWFLSEYLKRQRSSDTTQVLQAIERLGAAIESEPVVARPADPTGTPKLARIAAEIRAARDKVAGIGAADGGSVQDGANWAELIAGGIDTSDILLEAAGEIQELGRRYRATVGAGRAGDRLAERAGDIYAVCASEELLHRRVAVVGALIDTLERLAAAAKFEPAATAVAAPAEAVATAAPDAGGVRAASSPERPVAPAPAEVKPVAPEVGSMKETPSAPAPRSSLEIDSGVIAFLGGMTESRPKAAAAPVDPGSSAEAIADPTEGLPPAAVKALLW